MAKGEEKLVQLQILVPETGFPRTMFFNRFRVEREEGYAIVSFGLLSSSGILVDSYCCTFTSDALENNKKSLLEYYGKTGDPKTTLPPWQGVSSSIKSDIADIVNMTAHGRQAETALALFSQVSAVRHAQENKTVHGQPVALLRCSTDIQMHLIKALYE